MNFLAQYPSTPLVQEPEKHGSGRRVGFIVAVLIIVVALLGAGIYAGLIVRTAVSAGYMGYSATMESINALKQKQFVAAHTHATNAIQAWRATHEAFDRIRWTRWIPFIGSYRDAGNDIAEAGVFFTTALDDAVTLAEQLRAPLGSLEMSVDFIQLPREKRRAVLGALVNTPERIRTIRNNVTAGIDHFDRARAAIPASFIPTRLTDARAMLDVLESALNRFEDVAVILPDFAGYPEPTTSLFIFQNNDELRPTGGFIGAYGLLRTDSGVITSLRTDDVYRLDNNAPKDVKLPTPPEPIHRLLGVKKLFFRDANWSPDFPTSAALLLDLYQREDPRAPDIKSIVAITPTVLERLMQFTGPLTIDGVTFTTQNVTDVLEYEVEQGFAKKKIPLEDRKVIIGKLTDAVVAQLHRIPSSDTPKLLEVLDTALNEKQIMVYHRDPKIQAQIANRGWSGALAKNDDALLAYIDANLASLKTDQVMERSLDVKIDASQPRPRATVTMRYQNRGQFTWKTTRYQTYARLFAPSGSTLVEGSGFLKRPRSEEVGKVDVLSEPDYAVFGGFVSIEPGTERSVSFVIDLPERTSAKPHDLKLRIPKQSGTHAIPLTLSISSGTPVKSATPAEDRKKWGDNKYEIQTDLRVDQNFNVLF